jgi:hypothetical protein
VKDSTQANSERSPAVADGHRGDHERPTPLATFRPYPKSLQLARGPKRYRRKIASPKQWQSIEAAKQGPCRVCGVPSSLAPTQLHHVVPRDQHGDDVAENIVPVCQPCHDAITRRAQPECLLLFLALSDAEYAYAVEKAGEDVWERVYGLAGERVG